MKTIAFTIILLLLVSIAVVYSKPKDPVLKINKNKRAPSFTATDVFGNKITLDDFAGKKVFLTFYRNVGCPICNLRFHEIESQAGYFKQHDVVVLSVYESSASHMKQYLNGDTPFSIMIPDSTLALYTHYGVERSTGKLLKGMFHGAMGKMKKGKKLFTKQIDQDGNSNRIGADFLIDENGTVLAAHYGKYVGDHLPIQEIKNLLTQPAH